MATTVTEVPKISGDDILKVAKGTKENTWDAVKLALALSGEDAPRDIHECVNSMPQLFPDRESIEWRVLASTQARTILGAREAISDPMSVYFNVYLLNAHAKMVEWQNITDDDASGVSGGSSWLVWYIKSQDRTVAVKVTVDDHLKTPEGESGELEPFDMPISNVAETIEMQGNLFAELDALDI